MKIICDNCGTKYSIADEKVKGKVFKIRCKKCQHIIVVRGTSVEDAAEAEAPPAAASRAAASDFGDPPVWHVVVDREQVGPMAAAEVRDRFMSGEINADTYAWREGFADWVRLSTVDEFADLERQDAVPQSAGAPAAAAAAASWGADPGAGAAGADAGWGGWGAIDQPAAAEPAYGEPAADQGFDERPAMAADAPYGDGGGNVFGGAQAEPAGGVFSSDLGAGGSDIFAGAGGGQQLFPDEEKDLGGSDVQMTGQRGENSVLFSLSNLQHLAMGSKPGASPVSSAGSNGSKEAAGSGLIDIRGMAASTTAVATAATDDELPLLGGFAAPVAAAPVLMPAVAEERPRWLLPVVIGGGGLMLVAITVLVVILLTRDTRPPVVGSGALARADITDPQAGPGTPEVKGAEQAAKGEDKTADKPEAGKDQDEASTEKTEKVASKARPKTGVSRRRASAVRRPSRVARDEPAPKSVAARPGKKRDALDDLIDGALGGGRKPAQRKTERAQPSAASSNLPESLGRSEIQGGMRRIRGSVQGCYDRFKVPGLANVQVQIGRNGRVSMARIQGVFSGTPTGACVMAAVKSATFPPFKGSPITITYPFVLR